MMLKLRLLALLGLVLIGNTLAAHARHARPLTTTETEARNETFEPSLSGQLREARRITRFLAKALTLSADQLRAVETLTAAERQALALAPTVAEADRAQRAYRLAVHQVLDARQLSAYVALCQRLAGTAGALDGTGLATR
jgi:hypothetical protein